MSDKISTIHFAFKYLFLYLYSKNYLFKTNPKSFELIEELIINSLPLLSDPESQNSSETLCYLLLSLYNLYVFDLKKIYQNVSTLTKTKSNLHSSKRKP